MAKVVLSLTIGDADDDSFATSIYVERADTVTIATMLSDLNYFWNTVRVLITGQLEKAEVHIVGDLTSFIQNSFNAESDVEEQALFRWGTDNTNWSAFTTLPTIDETIFTGSGAGKTVDITDVNVQSYIDVMTLPVVGGGLGATDSHGVDLTSLRSAVQRFNGGHRG